MPSKIKYILSFALCLAALSGCSPKDCYVWSPNGQILAFIDDGNLRTTDTKGNLSQIKSTDSIICRWMPDSRHAILAASSTITQWKDLEPLLTKSEQDMVTDIAGKLWALSDFPQTKSEDEIVRQEMAYMQLSQKYGQDAASQRFKRALEAKARSFGRATAYSLYLVDMVDTDDKKTKLLSRNLQEIRDIRVSPTGKMVAVALQKGFGHGISVVSTDGLYRADVTVADAGIPAWTTDGKALMYFQYPPLKDEAALAQMHDTSERPFLATLKRAQIVDEAGAPLSQIASKDVIRAFADDVTVVRCLRDGSAVFHARPREYPVSAQAKTAPLALYRFKQDGTVTQIAGTSNLPPDLIKNFEYNADESKILLAGKQGQVAVMDVASSKMQDIAAAGQHQMQFQPQWRTADEICYAAIKDPLPTDKTSRIWDLALVRLRDPAHPVYVSKDWQIPLQNPSEAKQLDENN